MPRNKNLKLEKEGEMGGDADDLGRDLKRLNGRLGYLLRYGAAKEGLTVLSGGFVELNELLSNRLMTSHTAEEVLKEVESALSKRESLMFEAKCERGVTLVRARFARRFDKNPFHPGTRVNTLLECCLSCVSQNIRQFDLEGFPAENIINSLIHRLKRERRLSGVVFRNLLSSTLEHLDLEGVYLTEGMVRSVYRTCPHIRVLSLRKCRYIINDHLLEQTVRNLPRLESLNLAGCGHLTDKTVQTLKRHCPNLKHLNISMIREISEGAIIDLIQSCAKLEHLDIFDRRISTDGRQKIVELAKDKGLMVVLKGLTDPSVAPADPCAFLPNFGKVWY